MARPKQKPVTEMEVPDGGGLKINLYEVDGRHQAHLEAPGQTEMEGLIVGTGVSQRSCLRDAKVFLASALSAVDELLEAERK